MYRSGLACTKAETYSFQLLLVSVSVRPIPLNERAETNIRLPGRISNLRPVCKQRNSKFRVFSTRFRLERLLWRWLPLPAADLLTIEIRAGSVCPQFALSTLQTPLQSI